MRSAAAWHSEGVTLALWVIYYLLFLFWLLLIARIIVEMVRSFAHRWAPVGGVAVAVESIFTATDPPVRTLRRVIPPLRLGGVALDLSIMVLLLAVYILMRVVEGFALP